jgi:transient receptor potential cation channel subfamily V member 5
MVMGDLIRFVSIYLVFVMGFSQGNSKVFCYLAPFNKQILFPLAYYLIFLSFNTEEGTDDMENNPVPSPMESIVAMFLMSLTNFGDYYGAMDQTNHEIEAKV